MSTTPSVEPRADKKNWGWSRLLTQVTKSSRLALQCDMQQPRFGLVAEGLDELHALSVELLELLKENMPDQTGGQKG
jgi:hypothetical protein